MRVQQTIAAIAKWLSQHQQHQYAHRQLLIVSGSQDYCYDIVTFLIRHYQTSATLLLGNTLVPTENALSMGAYRQILGTEYPLAIIDSFDTFRPNAVLAAAGTITRGGLMVICCPDFSLWPTYHEVSTGHYLSYAEQFQSSELRIALIRHFEADPTVAVVRENHSPVLPASFATVTPSQPAQPFKSKDQHTIFAQITAGPSIQNALITADRGRGKSTLLGMIAGHCLAEKKQHVIVTSRYSDAVSQIFSGISLTCPQAKQTGRHHMDMRGISCKWLPLDHPSLVNLQQTVLLIIDEAANIPVPQLSALCEKATHILLSTTIRGYEGSGRGFVTRFLPWLKRNRPDVAHNSMHTPIRWLAKDPVEQFWYDAFYLEKQQTESTALASASTFDNTALYFRTLDKRNYDGPLNRQLLPLLMHAHYQTTADELVRIYDAPANYTIAACLDDQVVGVVNYQQEGGVLLKDVAKDIACGARRVNGHLSAQGLSVLLASSDMATAVYWRINRIAITPSFRRHGIASALINTLVDKAIEANVDVLSTSFGATKELIHFWKSNAFLAAKPGLKRDASSGEYSILMYRPLSKRIHCERPLIEQRFYQELWLHPTPDVFDMDLVKANCDLNNRDINSCSMNILQQVVKGTRSLQHARGSVAWFIFTLLKTSPECESLSVLRQFIGSVNSIGGLAQHYGLNGKRETEHFVIAHLNTLLAQYHQADTTQ